MTIMIMINYDYYTMYTGNGETGVITSNILTLKNTWDIDDCWLVISLGVINLPLIYLG